MADKTLSYTIFQEQRVIRLYHGDLDESWWKRGMSPAEIDMKRVESVLKQATGLQRLYRVHDTLHKYVDFYIREELFSQAAVAMRMTWEPDSLVEPILRRRAPTRG